MLRLKPWVWGEARAVRPVVHKVAVVSRWPALAEAKDVNEGQRERDDGDRKGLPKAAPQRTEQQEQRHDEKEDPCYDEPKQIAIQSPRPARGIVGTVRVRKAQFVVLLESSDFHRGGGRE